MMPADSAIDADIAAGVGAKNDASDLRYAENPSRMLCTRLMSGEAVLFRPMRTGV